MIVTRRPNRFELYEETLSRKVEHMYLGTNNKNTVKNFKIKRSVNNLKQIMSFKI